MIRRIFICAGFALGLAWLTSLGPSPAAAQSCDQECTRQLVQRGEVMALSQLIVNSGVAQQGEILDAQLAQCNGIWVYIFRLLNKAENNVFGAFYDARTGAPMQRVRCQ